MDLNRLKGLVTATALESWEGEVAAEHLAKCREILGRAARQLLELAPAQQPEELVSAIGRAVEQLNEADEPSHFIMTIEREDLCDFLGQLGAAAGLSDAQIDRGLAGRDW